MMEWFRRLFGAPDSEEVAMKKKAVSKALDEAHAAASEAAEAVDEAHGAAREYWAAADKQTAERYRAANGLRRSRK